MNRNVLGIVCGVLVCVAVAFGNMASAAGVGPFGPSMGAKADVVRAFTMKVSGASKSSMENLST